MNSSLCPVLLCLIGASPQVTVQVQGQEVLSEKMEPPSFQPLPQTKPQLTESGPEMPPGTVQELPLGLQVKEEPEVTENPGEARQGGQGVCMGGGSWPEQS